MDHVRIPTLYLMHVSGLLVNGEQQVGSTSGSCSFFGTPWDRFPDQGILPGNELELHEHHADLGLIEDVYVAFG
jgi:hypothetical protein